MIEFLKGSSDLNRDRRNCKAKEGMKQKKKIKGS
jgi:hypothetical protein